MNSNILISKTYRKRHTYIYFISQLLKTATINLIVFFICNQTLQASNQSLKPSFSKVIASAQYGSSIDVKALLYLPIKNKKCTLKLHNYNFKTKSGHSGIGVGNLTQRYSTLYQMDFLPSQKVVHISNASGGCQLKTQTKNEVYQSIVFNNSNSCEFDIISTVQYVTIRYHFYVSGKGQEEKTVDVEYSC